MVMTSRLARSAGLWSGRYAPHFFHAGILSVISWRCLQYQEGTQRMALLAAEGRAEDWRSPVSKPVLLSLEQTPLLD